MNDPFAWARIAPYLDAVLDLEPGESSAWLDELGATQPEIASALRQFLSESDALDSEGFLDGAALPLTQLDTLMPLLEQKMRDPKSGDLPQDPPEFAQSSAGEGRLPGVGAGTVLGPYRLLREIGHGGMSSVWLAERIDGQLKREVALKMPFVGPRRAQMAERFKRERDILATLAHPNIATLYDAGVSASGQSYLAMEYVRGAVLTLYCDAGRRSIRERLKYFLQVLAAVAFAHTQLVLHRDLKPSNILVTEQGRVVLLDFGIAKLLSQEVLPAPPLTEMAERMLTPDYASPEHIAGRALDTTSDVYSLGVVLYELLAGSRPFGSQFASRRELEDAILTQDPSRPSQRVFTDEIAAARHTTPRKLAQMLAGDLDTIILKALKRTPAERYRSIDAFAQDIQNYLGNLPVSVRPDSLWYRFSRFVARYKLQVGAASVTLIALIGGGATALWQARTAAEERDRALVLASRSEAINEFMDTLITEAAYSTKPITVSEMLARSEVLATANASGNAESRAAILGMIGQRYGTLGELRKAARLLERALSLLGSSRDSGLRSQMTCAHALVLLNLGETDAAIKEISRELESRSLDTETEAQCLLKRSFMAANIGDTQGAVRYANLGLERFHRTARKTPTHEALFLVAIANGHQLVGETGQANRFYELALQKYTEAGRERSIDAASAISNWALMSSGAGNPRRALELYDQVSGIEAERAQGDRSSSVLVSNRARALESIGRFTQARDAYELGRLRAIEQGRLSTQAFSLVGLASIAHRSGDLTLAANYLQQAVELLGSSLPPDHRVWMKLAVIRGRLHLADGKLAAARAEFDRVLARPLKDWLAVEASLGKTEAELLAGDATAAVADAHATLNIATSLQSGIPYSSYTGLSWLNLGRALEAQGETQQARNAFAAAVNHLSKTVDADHPELLRARELLAPGGEPRE